MSGLTRTERTAIDIATNIQALEEQISKLRNEVDTYLSDLEPQINTVAIQAYQFVAKFTRDGTHDDDSMQELAERTSILEVAHENNIESRSKQIVELTRNIFNLKTLQFSNYIEDLIGTPLVLGSIIYEYYDPRFVK